MQSLINTVHTRLVFGRRVRVLAEALAQMIPPGSRVLDVGCGDGKISAQIANRARNISISLDNVLLRPHCYIPVTHFNGSTHPYPNASFDVVMFVDVLHHTKDPAALLAEARRVTRKYLLLKDHFRTGPIGDVTLRVMDWFGDAHHNVVLPYNYLSETEWEATLQSVRFRDRPAKEKTGPVSFSGESGFRTRLAFHRAPRKKPMSYMSL